MNELMEALRAWVAEKDRIQRQEDFDTRRRAVGSYSAPTGVSDKTRERFKAASTRLHEAATRVLF